MAMELSQEIQWRVEVFRKQVPPKGVIPCLFARPDAPTGTQAEGRCRSCGDPIPVGPPHFCPERSTPLLCCDACQQAAMIVLEESG